SSFSTHVISLRLLSLSSACSVPPPYLHSFPTRRSSDLAMFRMFTLLFYHEPSITHTLIGIMAGITLIGGSIGAIARTDVRQIVSDRKSTRLNSSHVSISYAVFCLKKKKKRQTVE